MSLSKLSVSLADEPKWLKFHPRTEMIVTKRRGRCLFPHLDYVIRGLEKEFLYTMHVHLERVDGIKYKYDDGEWKEAAKGDPLLPIEHKEHADGARTGEHWMRASVSFSTLKITNDPKNADAKLIVVQSMHKYQPVLTITRISDGQREEFRLKLTEFIVVTAYQSEQITELKVAHNKFASGFRPNGKRRNSSDEVEQEQAKKRASSSPVDPPMNFPMTPFYAPFPMTNNSFLPTDNQFNNNFDWNQYNPSYFHNQHNYVHMNTCNVPPADPTAHLYSYH